MTGARRQLRAPFGVNDKAGKPVGINRQIGRRPIAVVGDSDGDLEMLQWTTMSGGRRLGIIVLDGGPVASGMGMPVCRSSFNIDTGTPF